MSKAQTFSERRAHLNEIVMQYAGLNTKRFFNLDTQIYKSGALPEKTKEMLGLVASLVLRCDDCISYHLINCHQQGISDAELEELLSVGLIVGGSIIIPHLRCALELWDELQINPAKSE